MSGTISGSEVTSGNGCVVSISENPTIQIHRGYNRLICLGDDSPNPSIQAFDWRVIREEGDTGMVNVSSYGTITATTYGRVIVEGTYKYNTRYKVRIVINVV